MKQTRSSASLSANNRAVLTASTTEDVEASTGALAGLLLATLPRDAIYWALAPLDQMKANLASTGYPAERIDYVVGDVCDRAVAAGYPLVRVDPRGTRTALCAACARRCADRRRLRSLGRLAPR